MHLPRVVIAAPGSGAGKTTITLGLLLALRERGVRVQPFKVGPDFIDPSHHTAIAGQPSRNLDAWLCADDVITEIFVHAAADAEISIIEGVMGLYDGASPQDERGSTAHVAIHLEAPVVLVIDAQAMATTAAAIALGCRAFDSRIRIAGVIFNNVGGAGHYEWLRTALEERTGIRALGYLAHDADLAIEERHLGLVPAPEQPLTQRMLQRLGDAMVSTVDVDAVIDAARHAPELRFPARAAVFGAAPSGGKVRIAVAIDRALNFYYRDNLDVLEHLGADIVPFSVLESDSLPQDIDGLYLGGGFPEMHAEALAAQASIKSAIRALHAAGGVIYAECGGLMVLCETLTGLDGRTHEMVGLVPAAAVMKRQGQTLGYVEVETLGSTILGEPGTRYRGQTFHNSVLERAAFEPALALRHGGRMSRDGFVCGHLLASYVHAHFAGAPHLASSIVRHCTRVRATRHIA